MLSQLPNIGPELEKRLALVGITSLEDLTEIGSLGVLQKLDAIHQPGCINMLYALEGAIQGVRWHHLAVEVKSELKASLKMLQYR